MSTEFLTCRTCKIDLPVLNFTPSEVKAKQHRCKACVSSISLAWYHKNRQYKIDKVSARTDTMREEVNARVKQWRLRNPERSRAATKRSADALKERVFSHYGKVCACCAEICERFLCIDHINNDGNVHRKKAGVKSGTPFYSWLERNNFPADFQTLCYNCNQGKHQNGGVCPHQDPRWNIHIVPEGIVAQVN